MELMYRPAEENHLIPEEWRLISCADACVKIQDGTHFSPKIKGNDFLYLTSKNIRFGYLDISTASRIDAFQHDAIYKRCDVKYGDLLLTKDGANTGNAAINSLSEPFSLLSSVAFLRFDPEKNSAQYFLQQMLSPEGQQQMKDAMSGNAITRLTLEKIRQLTFPAPPLCEQHAIATALSDVDALIAGLEKLIAKKRDLKQAAMQQLLTGQTRLPGFSGEWAIKPLGDVAQIQKGQLITTETIVSGDVPVIAGGKKPAYFHNKPNRLGKTITVSASGASAGYVAFHRSPIFASDCSTISEAKTYCIEFVFFAMQLKQEEIYNAQTGGAQPHIQPKDLAPLMVPFPTKLREQEAIALVLCDMDYELISLESRLSKTRELKQGMMQELLTGRTRLV